MGPFKGDSHELVQFLDRLVQGENRGYLNYLRFHAYKVLPGKNFKLALSIVDRIRDYSGDISILMEDLQNERNDGYNLRCEIPRDYEALKEAVKSLSTALSALARFLEEHIAEIITKDDAFENSSLFRQGENYIKTCLAWASLLEKIYEEKVKENSCCYLDCSSSNWSFCIAPLDVNEHFYSKVITGSESIILTSATLAEKGNYIRPARALGLDRLEPERLVFKMPLPYVYDYAQNSVLAIPNDSPGYGSEAFADYAAKAVLGMARMLQGRTMVLFTSIKRMERAMEIVRVPLEHEGISVLGGRFSSNRSDLELFRKDANAVLFGSRSFFEGIDIKGLALSCIIIEKLSFAFRSDPLHKARSVYLEKMGLNPFIEVNLAEATKTLRQQFGRLIRSEVDRGVVIVLDQLGGDKWYCEHIVKELPGPQLINGVKLEEIIFRIDTIFREWGY